jgi:DNA-binding helix-hairpin-helix protein with protein kinase domain
MTRHCCSPRGFPPVPPRTLFDARGQAITLGPLLASGGEGAVSHVADQPGLVAKIYHRPPDASRIEKLRRMVAQDDPVLARCVAWPTTTLHESRGGLLVGFLMPRFEGYRAIHTLYSPAHRRTTFPQADWTFLAHAARNCAAAFETVHARGHVIGDVNQSNVLVSSQALIALIDCDSFQVRSGGQTYRCEVGVGPFTPPELQEQNFRDLDRTPDHDRFGLAVLLFHLLFMGRHPFAGRYLGSGEMPLERAIAEHRFVYTRSGPPSEMAAPPFSLPLAAVGAPLADLFERAFRPGGKRPAAADWHQALVGFLSSLRSCKAEPGHKVPSWLSVCPWCGIVTASGPNFFLGVGLAGGVFRVNFDLLETVWRRIEEVSNRSFQLTTPPLPPPTPRPLPWRARFGRRLETPRARTVLWWAFITLIYCTCLSVIVGSVDSGRFWWSWPVLVTPCVVATVFCAQLLACTEAREKERSRRDEALQEATKRQQAIHRQAAVASNQHGSDCYRVLSELRSLKQQIGQLEGQFESRRPRKTGPPDPSWVAAAQERYLRNQFLSDHRIAGIGPSRITLLASYGLETAYDVTAEALAPVKGIGKVLRDNLLAWRESVEKNFSYDPARDGPIGDAPPTLVLEFKQAEERLRGRLMKGAADLTTLQAQTEARFQTLQTQFDEATRLVAQTTVDLELAWRV